MEAVLFFIDGAKKGTTNPDEILDQTFWVWSMVRINTVNHSDVDKVSKLKKRLLIRCIHHFESDWINDMDHMRISGTEPSSVILSQRK